MVKNIKIISIIITALVAVIVSTHLNAEPKDIRFYGKVIDQNGDPVVGASITYDAVSGYLQESTGRGFTETNNQGIFVTDEAKGSAGVSIREIKKTGYDIKMPEPSNFDSYKRFSDSVLWMDYKKDNPYIFKVWKVGNYPRVASNKEDHRTTYGFIPDGREYTLNFLVPKRKIKNNGSSPGQLKVVFNRTEDQWSLLLKAVDGGLQESTDQYMNVAPEDGYQDVIEYKFNKADVSRIEKKYYFVSHIKSDVGVVKNNNYSKAPNKLTYGRLEMTILPYYRKNSVIELFYVVNVESERNLAVESTRARR